MVVKNELQTSAKTDPDADVYRQSIVSKEKYIDACVIAALSSTTGGESRCRAFINSFPAPAPDREILNLLGRELSEGGWCHKETRGEMKGGARPSITALSLKGGTVVTVLTGAELAAAVRRALINISPKLSETIGAKKPPVQILNAKGTRPLGLAMEVVSPAPAAAVWKSIPIGEISKAPFNPRKTFDEKALNELADSIRQKGIAVPILVRPYRGGYQIVAGERRWRAGKIAGLTAIPCMVREYTDVEALEFAIIENGQREDCPALEEGEGYKELMTKGGFSVEQIAEKTGKSVSHVYQRLKLAELIEPAKKLLLNETLSPGHAILLARLSPDDQKTVLARCVSIRGEGGEVSTVRGMNAYIQREIFCELKAAPFDQADATLDPKAGACSACPKRTGNNLALFANPLGDGAGPNNKDQCTDGDCYKSKCDLFIARKKIELQQDSKKPIITLTERSWDCKDKKAISVHSVESCKPNDPKAVKALVIDGEGIGKVRTVKMPSAADRNPYKQQAHEKRMRKKADREKQFRRQLLSVIGDKVTDTLTQEQQVAVALGIVKAFRSDECRELVAFARTFHPDLGVKGKTYDHNFAEILTALPAKELPRWLVILALASELSFSAWGDSKPKRMLAIAAKLKVDVEKVRKSCTEED